MKKWFSALLVIIFVIQEPFLARADYFSRDVYRSRQAFQYCLAEEVLRGQNPDNKGEFAIRYCLNGGSLAAGSPASYTSGDLPVVPGIATKEGYNFAGWYADSGFKYKIGAISVDASGDYQLYAKWTKGIDGDYSVQIYPYQGRPSRGITDKKLKDCEYSFLQEVDIPGMPSTREADAIENRITGTGQCLQGICMTDDYLLISSYSGGNPGCIHIFEKAGGAYLATLGVNRKSHLGGLAFDGENVWVCHSESKSLGRIPYSYIRQVALQKPRSVVESALEFEECRVSNTPSCIAYHDGKLWVATHTKVFSSRMTAYQVTEDGLRPTESYRIPDKVQGIAFDGEGRVYLSSSYGRKSSSYLKVYESADEMDKKPGRPAARVEMPPCSEEIDMDAGRVYVLFESAGEKYFEGTDGKGKSVSPIDKVLVVSASSVLP